MIYPLLAVLAAAFGFFCTMTGGNAYGEPLLANGNLATADATGQWVAGWPRAEGVTWEREAGDGNQGLAGGGSSGTGGSSSRFLRFTQQNPGKMVSLFNRVTIPEGTAALRLRFRVRYKNVVAGEKPWFDATVMLTWRDLPNGGNAVLPAPDAPHYHGSSQGWVDFSAILLVPQGARALDISPALFNATRGTLDIADFVLEAATPEEVARQKAVVEDRKPLPVPATEAPQTEKWPAELKVVGNRLQTKDGREVWLQGIVIPSLEWSATGENALASAKVAIEEWKGNILRLEVRDDFWFGTSPHQSDGGKSYRALVDAAVNLAANRGVYTTIDLHRYRAVRPEHVTFWKELAGIYGNHPAVIFDIFNEPHGITWEVWRNGGPVAEKQGKADEDAFLTEAEKMKSATSFESPGMQAIVNTIRDAGARNIIVAAGLNWSLDLSGITKGFALEDKSGNGIMYCWHVYNWHTDWEKNMAETAALHPIMVAECGADPNKMSFVPAEKQEDPATWSPRFIAFVQRNKLNWTAFSFHPRCTPVLISDWKFTPTPGWGALVKQALAGKQFEYQGTK